MRPPPGGAFAGFAPAAPARQADGLRFAFRWVGGSEPGAVRPRALASWAYLARTRGGYFRGLPSPGPWGYFLHEQKVPGGSGARSPCKIRV